MYSQLLYLCNLLSINFSFSNLIFLDRQVNQRKLLEMLYCTEPVTVLGSMFLIDVLPNTRKPGGGAITVPPYYHYTVVQLRSAIKMS